jgi:hypothetical protein
MIERAAAPLERTATRFERGYMSSTEAQPKLQRMPVGFVRLSVDVLNTRGKSARNRRFLALRIKRNVSKTIGCLVVLK